MIPTPLIALTALVILASGAGLWLLLSGEDSSRAEVETVTFESALEAYEAGEYSASESALERLVAQDGSDLESRKALAQVYAAVGKNAEAIEQYDAIVKADPDDHETLYRLAVLERLMGDSFASITHLERAVEIEPGEAYLNDLALTYVQVGRYEDAVAVWRRVLDVADLDEAGQAGVYSAIATAYEGMRDYEGARAALAQALSFAPNDANLKVRLESISTP